MKRAKFLKYPEYPGGKTSLNQYIQDNLVYPADALKQKIEGNVLLSAEINDNGEIREIRVEKGLGHGCDEEAVRLLKGIHFGGVSNPGIRLKTKKKFRIPFRIKKEKELQGINYSMKKVPEEKKTGTKTAVKEVYHYTIKWNTGNVNDGPLGV
jgi:TonB family protein